MIWPSRKTRPTNKMAAARNRSSWPLLKKLVGGDSYSRSSLSRLLSSLRGEPLPGDGGLVLTRGDSPRGAVRVADARGVSVRGASVRGAVRGASDSAALRGGSLRGASVRGSSGRGAVRGASVLGDLVRGDGLRGSSTRGVRGSSLLGSSGRRAWVRGGS